MFGRRARGKGGSGPGVIALAAAFAVVGFVAGPATSNIASATTWTYRTLNHESSEVRDPGSEQLAYARQRAGNLTRVRIGESAYYTRLVLDFDDRTRFVVQPVTDRTLEITLFKLLPDQIGQQLDSPKGLISSYRFEPDGIDSTKIIVQGRVPISISVMGDLAPDETLGHYRLFFDFVERGQALTNPSFVQRPVDLGTQPQPGTAGPAQVQPDPQPDLLAQQPAPEEDEYLSDDVDPRDEGVYLRASGGFVWTADTRDNIGTVSDDAGNGFKVAAAVGYRPLPFLRMEVEGGYFGGFEVENAAGKGDVDGAYAALNGFIALAREFWVIRPYIGAGIGVSHNKVDDISGGTALPAGGNEDTDFMWQLFAGAEIQAIDNLSVDLGYRFAHHGEISSDASASGVTYDGELRAHEVVSELLQLKLTARLTKVGAR